jgi:superfamily I DNA/RNA helicase/RecB family exonuclease
VKVYSHPDPWVLERELVRRVESAHPRDGRGSTLILVPTSRLAAHVERRLAATGGRGAWLGLHVRTFHGVARRILEASRVALPCVASERLRRTLVRRLLDAQPENPWSIFVRARPGAASRVSGALVDLREAGITPDELRATAGDEPGPAALAELYEAYARALDEGIASGFTDETGLVRAALAEAPQLARAHGAIFLHGAYELLGIHVELLRALDSGRQVTALVPVRTDAPATAYAERFARSFLGSGEDPTPIEADAGAGSGLALEALYRESSRPDPVAPARVSFHTCQGASAEVDSAVRRALAAIARGVPPTEIAIVARSLAPYAGAIDELLTERSLPYTSSAVSPLRRRPFVRDLLLLLRVVERDFPRAATVELLRSRSVDWGRIVRERPSGERADAWSLRARLVGGLAEWTLGLTRWIEDDEARAARRRPEEPRSAFRLDEARRIGATLSVLRGRVGPAPRGWSEHATRIRTLAEELLVARDGVEDESAVRLLGEILLDMERLETWLLDRRRVPFGEAVDWLEQAVDQAEHKPKSEDRGGIRVLDALPARGLTFEHVQLLGMNAGVFPRKAIDDPILGDTLRRRLRERTGRPIPVAGEALDEERLLLLLLAGSSRTSLEVSWQRAAEAGRVRSPSLALRELARIARGRPDLGALEPIEVPSHPEHGLRHAIADGSGITADERTLLFALSSAVPAMRARLAQVEPGLADGLHLLAATETFETVDPAYDGRIDRVALPPEGLSVSAVERLGQCPLRFFFQHVLRVREPANEVDPLELDPRDVGGVVHDRLAEIYGTLEGEGLLAPESLARALERAEELQQGLRHVVLGRIGERMAGRFPVMWEHLAAQWEGAIACFVRADLERLSREGLRVLGVEVEASRELAIGGGLTLRLRGRFDRVLEGPGALVLSDYKTTRKVERIDELVDEGRMLRAEDLQVPLYQWLEARVASVEVLGVGPSFAGDTVSRAEFRGFTKPQRREGFLETISVLLDLARQGRFPLRDRAKACEFCPYERACRHRHAPTRVRQARDADGRTCAALWAKAKTRPLLTPAGNVDG